MKLPASLRQRLLIGGALWIAVALAASWVFIFLTFAALIDADRRADLSASLDRIVAELDPDSTPPLTGGLLLDPRYDTPLSGVYWQITDVETGEVMRSRSLWDIDLPTPPLEGTNVIQQVEVPDRPTLIALGQTIRVERSNGTERVLGVVVAEERSSDSDPVRIFGATLALFLTILAAMLLVALVVQVRVGLKPLETLRQNIAAVRHGRAERLADGSSLELEPVTAQINELLEAQEGTIAFVRQRAADLAHGLKTPLAVLEATADRLRDEGDAANAETLSMLSVQMNERIDYQLRIARLRFRTRAQGVFSSTNESVLRSVAVLRKGRHGERINWVVDLAERLEADMDRHDLMELVGIVLENAQKWARTRVAIRGRRTGAFVEFTIEDDGGGLNDEQIEKLGQRGVRFDEREDGNGLGLAIAFEIVRLNRGTIELGRSELGGLLVRIRLQAGAAPTPQA